MHNEQADILIIGGGITGCILFYELSRRNIGKVILCEKSQIANGVTRESAGYIRQFHLHSELQARMQESYAYYQRFYRDNNLTNLFIKTGFTQYFPAALQARIEKNISEFQGLRNYRVQLSHTSSRVIVQEESAGRINAIETCKEFVNFASHTNSYLLENTAAQKIVIQNNMLQGVQTSAGMIHAKHVIITAGVGNQSLLAPFFLNEFGQIKAFQYNFYSLSQSHDLTPMIDVIDDLYIVPLSATKLLAGFLNEDKVNANAMHPDIDQAQRVHRLAQEKLPTLILPTNYQMKCSVDMFSFYEEDSVKSVPGIHELIFATGGSGGGIKVAPAIARQLIAALS